MKIVTVSNYDKEFYFEKEVCKFSPEFEHLAEYVAEALCKQDSDGPDLFVVKPDDYVLYKFKP